MRPPCLYDWAGEGDVVDTLIVVPFLPLRLEVHARPSGDHVDDSAIWLLDEVFLLWCLGVIMVVWIWVMRRRGRRGNNLHFLMMLVCVVGWMLDVLVVVWLLLLVVVCVRDDSLVVGWLCSRHPVPSGLRFRAISCWVGAILAMKQTVKSAWLLRPFPAAPSRAVTVALGDIPSGERLLRRATGWLCCAPAVDCGCPVRSLAAKAWSRFCWTVEGP
jgi:hypothetical protein